MFYFSEKDRIVILIIIDYGDRVKTHEEVSDNFTDLHPYITFNDTKTLQRFKATKILPKIGT